MIPLVDLAAQYAAHKDELDQAVARVIANSGFIGGAEHAAFGEDFAAWCGGGHVALCGNGTDALTLAMVERLGAGDGEGEVITSSFSFVATGEAIVNAGYRPVFADIDPATCLIDPDRIEAAITPRTRAIVPVHLYGQMAAMDRIVALGLPVIEDAAQAHGARTRGLGPGQTSDAACFSFYPGKNLGAWGDGGAIFTRDGDLAERIRRRANHGRAEKYVHDTIGVNSRLDGLQAAVLGVKLRHIDAWTVARRGAAALYDSLLADCPAIGRVATAEAAAHVHHLYVVRVRDRDRVRGALNAAGIGAGVHYPLPIHAQPAFAAYGRPSLPETERAAAEVLSLPLYAEITEAQVARVAEGLREAVA